MFLMLRGAAAFLPVTVILLRELYISGLREYLASKKIQLPVSNSGKWKTALQLVAIGLFLAVPLLHGLIVLRMLQLGTILLYVAALLAVISAAQYTRIALKQVK